jgi:hypothetical protein
MTMNQFLIQFAVVILTQVIPICAGVYLAIRLGIAHGALALTKKTEKKLNN